MKQAFDSVHELNSFVVVAVVFLDAERVESVAVENAQCIHHGLAPIYRKNTRAHYEVVNIFPDISLFKTGVAMLLLLLLLLLISYSPFKTDPMVSLH